MSEGSDTNYWSLVTIVGPIILLVLFLWVVAKSRKRKSEMSQPETEAGTREVYREEQRIHERDPGSGL